jgi:hypothetical protein
MYGMQETRRDSFDPAGEKIRDWVLKFNNFLAFDVRSLALTSARLNNFVRENFELSSSSSFFRCSFFCVFGRSLSL